MLPVSAKLCVLLNKTTARAYYGHVNNKPRPFSSAILVLPLPDTNGVTLPECRRLRDTRAMSPNWLKLNESMVAKMVSRVSYLIYYNLYIE